MSELHITLGWADWLALLLQFMLLGTSKNPRPHTLQSHATIAPTLS